MKFKYIIIAMAALIISLAACQKNEERPPYIPEEEEPTVTGKEFVVYDAMYYKGKPDLSADKISPFRLIYEAALLDDAKNIDNAKIANQISITKTSGVKTVSLDIEDWYTNKTGDQIAAGLKQIFDMFKAEIPDCRIGNYGIPVSDLNVYRYAKENHTDPNFRNMTEEQFIAWWKDNNAKRIAAGEACDIMFPSAYIITGVEQWKKDMKVMADFIREKFPRKKIIAYVWPHYYDNPMNPDKFKMLSPEDWDALLEGAFECFDGIILWSNGKDETGTVLNWTDSKVQAMHNATKAFIQRHDSDIIFEKTGTNIDDEEVEPTEFEIFGTLNFTGTPNDLRAFGIQPIQPISEAIVSAPEKVNDIYVPQVAKLEAAASKVQLPVFFQMGSWIVDRTSDNAAMEARFKLVYDTFKAKNPNVKVGYRGVGPTSLTSLRVTSYTSTDVARADSWQRYAAEPARVAKKYADYISPEVTIINDDIDVWKSDCSAVLKEAKSNNAEGKKIYAVLKTAYFNKLPPVPADYVAFPDAYKPIKETTWAAALEYLYMRCDGIIIEGNLPSSSPVAFSEDLGLMKATKAFYLKHKAVIDKKLPSTVVVPVPENQLVSGVVDPEEPVDPVDPVEPGTNLIINGSFEDDLPLYSVAPLVHNNEMKRLPRLWGFFDATGRTTFPTFSTAPAVADGQWFERTYNDKWFWFTYVVDKNQTLTNYNDDNTVAVKTGNRAFDLYSAYCNNFATNAPAHQTNLEHLFGIGQRLSLDDTKKYTLKFSYYRPDLAWGPTSPTNSAMNYAEKIVVGIVSSTGAVKETDYTYEKVIVLEKVPGWKDYELELDLPAIIASNPGKSFSKAAVFFNIVPYVENNLIQRGLVTIDDVSLTLKP